MDLKSEEGTWFFFIRSRGDRVSLGLLLFRPSSAGSVYSPFCASSDPLVWLLGGGSTLTMTGFGASSTMGGREETRSGGGGRRLVLFGLREGPMLLRVSTRLSMSLWMGESASGEDGGVEGGGAGSEVKGGAGSEVRSTRVALKTPVKLEESVSSKLLHESC